MGKSLILLLGIISLFATSCAYKLSNYEEHLVGCPASQCKPSRSQVSVTYLGTSGFLVENDKTAIAIDPYFSRYNMRTIALNGPISPKQEVINWGAKEACFPKSIDGWLVTHAHFDHALDLPVLQNCYGGTSYASCTGRALLKAAGVPARRTKATTAGKRLRIGKAKVTVLSATHDRIFGQIPYPGHVEGDVAPPCRPRDWKIGEPLAFLIEIGGKRIYIESGGMGDIMPSEKAKGVDLAIMGVAVADSQNRYPDAVKYLCPKHVLPVHQDNFFRPLEDGFQFAAMANFPKILASHEAEQLPGELVLMDYFHEWILP